MGVSQDSGGWTVVTPSGDVSGTTTADTLIAYVSDSDGDDGNDGRDPLGLSLSGATYTHSSRTVTSAGAFSGFTLSSDPYANKLWITAATGGVTANRLYEIEGKTSNDAVVLVANSGLTSDATGISSGTGPKATPNAGYGLLRHGSPDWLLLKRGDEWESSLTADGRWKKEGLSASEPIMASSYGSTATARPLLKTGAIEAMRVHGGASTPASLSHIYLIGIHFYAHTRDPQSPDYSGASGPSGVYWAHPGEDFLIEDAVFSFYNGNLVIQSAYVFGNFRLRRSLIVDAYAYTGHAQGLYVSGIDGILIEENVFDHNGWYGDRDTGGIPGGEATIFNHNIYIDNENPEAVNTRSELDHVVVRNNLISRASSHGIQARPGGTVEENTFIQDPLSVQVGGGDDFAVHQPDGVDGIVRNNVILQGNDINSTTPRGGSLVKNIRSLVMVNNVIAHKEGGGERAFDVLAPSRGAAVNSNTFYEINQGGVTIESGVTDITTDNNLYWDMPVTGTNRNIQDDGIVFADSERSAATYSASLGGAGTLEAFLTACRANRKGSWNAAYTAAQFNAYIRAGFQEAGDGGADNRIWYGRVRNRIRVKLPS